MFGGRGTSTLFVEYPAIVFLGIIRKTEKTLRSMPVGSTSSWSLHQLLQLASCSVWISTSFPAIGLWFRKFNLNKLFLPKPQLPPKKQNKNNNKKKPQKTKRSQHGPGNIQDTEIGCLISVFSTKDAFRAILREVPALHTSTWSMCYSRVLLLMRRISC